MTNRKKNSFKKYTLWFLLCIPFVGMSQDEKEEAPKAKALLGLRYYCQDNRIPSVSASLVRKANKKVEPIAGVSLSFYLNDSEDPSMLIGKIKTGIDGKAYSFFPPEMQKLWPQEPGFKIMVISDSIPEFGILENELEITKARIKIDSSTEEESRNVTVFVEMLQDSLWVPAADVELKIGVSRLGGSLLKIGEEESYTTDSTGSVSGEFLLDSLPSGADANIQLMARIEDHELFGSIDASLMVPWGHPSVTKNDFGKRSLWATGDRVPLWLLSLALFIIASVWGTLLILIWRFFKMKKLGA